MAYNQAFYKALSFYSLLPYHHFRLANLISRTSARTYWFECVICLNQRQTPRSCIMKEPDDNEFYGTPTLWATVICKSELQAVKRSYKRPVWTPLLSSSAPAAASAWSPPAPRQLARPCSPLPSAARDAASVPGTRRIQGRGSQGDKSNRQAVPELSCQDHYRPARSSSPEQISRVFREWHKCLSWTCVYQTAQTAFDDHKHWLCFSRKAALLSVQHLTGQMPKHAPRHSQDILAREHPQPELDFLETPLWWPLHLQHFLQAQHITQNFFAGLPSCSGEMEKGAAVHLQKMSDSSHPNTTANCNLTAGLRVPALRSHPGTQHVLPNPDRLAPTHTSGKRLLTLD